MKSTRKSASSKKAAAAPKTTTKPKANVAQPAERGASTRKSKGPEVAGSKPAVRSKTWQHNCPAAPGRLAARRNLDAGAGCPHCGAADDNQAVVAAAGAPTSRHRVDWPAVERDFRTGKFSNVELCKKHDIAPATLSRQIKKDQALDLTRWQRDLTEVVRQATNARLMSELVKSEVQEGQAKVNETVKIAAEVNAQVILRHRNDIAATNALAMSMLAELAGVTHSPEKLAALFEQLQGEMSEDELVAARLAFGNLLRLGNRVSSVQKLADTLAKVQTLERKAFGLDDSEKDEKPELADQIAAFMGDLHQSGSARLPFVKRAPKA